MKKLLLILAISSFTGNLQAEEEMVTLTSGPFFYQHVPLIGKYFRETKTMPKVQWEQEKAAHDEYVKNNPIKHTAEIALGVSLVLAPWVYFVYRMSQLPRE